MKYVYLIIVLLLSFNVVSAQDEILGDWYLYSINIENSEIYNLDIGENQPKLTFNTVNGNSSYEGTVCNDYGGTCVINASAIEINDLGQLLEPCDFNNPEGFEQLYFYNILTDIDDPSPNLLDYQITGTGSEQTLVLTDNTNSNIATFGRTQQTPNIIGLWYLYNLVIDSNQINNPNGSNPDIFFSTNLGDLLGYTLYGSGVCNGFQSDYYFNPQQTFNAEFISATLALCDTAEEELFENYYFYQVLSTITTGTAELDYEITGTGDDATLIITNLVNGNQAFYGRQALSTDENEFNSSKISLNRNPISNSLDLSTTQNLTGSNYEIFSITGQRITNGSLTSNSINVNQLHSGLYVLKVSTDKNRIEMVKFIKE
tara:strand:- start:3384 stop:4502 length:1119 start_codon:yes stop_codon:yes gene_type:complete